MAAPKTKPLFDRALTGAVSGSMFGRKADRPIPANPAALPVAPLFDPMLGDTSDQMALAPWVPKRASWNEYLWNRADVENELGNYGREDYFRKKRKMGRTKPLDFMEEILLKLALQDRARKEKGVPTLRSGPGEQEFQRERYIERTQDPKKKQMFREQVDKMGQYRQDWSGKTPTIFQ